MKVEVCIDIGSTMVLAYDFYVHSGVDIGIDVDVGTDVSIADLELLYSSW